MSVAITLKSIPDEMMESFRSIAKENHRSVSGEIMYRLKKSLAADAEVAHITEGCVREDAGIIADEWEKIGGGWISDSSIEDEIAEIYSVRSLGRDEDLSL